MTNDAQKTLHAVVFGGDGFIGSHIVDALLREGCRVTVFDRFPYSKTRNLEHVRDHIDIYSGELTYRQDLDRALAGQDLVFHFASGSNPAATWEDPMAEVDESIRSALLLFEAAAENGVRKIVFPSSGGTVYGTPKREAVDENSPTLPINPYGIAKLAIERFLVYYAQRFGVNYDIYRIANAYGPRQPVAKPQGVIAVWMKQLIRGDKLAVFGGDESLRDYIHVQDIAELIMHSVRDPDSSDVYNIGTGRGLSVMELLEIFKKTIPQPFESRVDLARQFDNRSSVLNSRKLTAHFPDFACRRLEDELPALYEYYGRVLHKSA